MKEITVESYGKINLSLDVIGRMDNGYHQVEMVMAQVGIRDQVEISYEEKGKDLTISVTTDSEKLGVEKENIGYKAYREMKKRYGKDKRGHVHIHIKKNIPIAAGLAGGSGNGAAVLHGLNILWELDLSLEDLCTIGATLGSDVPFCIMGQGKLNGFFEKDFLACTCALGTGTGTELMPLPPIEGYVVLATPNIEVSTKEVYEGIDKEIISFHPNTKELVQGLREKDFQKVKDNMENVLELFTFKRYDSVVYTKNNMKRYCIQGKVLMSGSGPTIFLLTESRVEAEKVAEEIGKTVKNTFLTKIME